MASTSLDNNVVEKVACVLPAAGRGERCGLGQPKQFVPVAGRPLFLHAVHAFLALPYVDPIVLVVQAGSEQLALRFLNLWVDRAEAGRVHVVAGQSSRHRSIQCGLLRVRELCAATYKPNCRPIVLVHDAVRPLLPRDEGSTLRSLIDKAREYGACGIVRPLVSTPLATMEDRGTNTTFMKYPLERARHGASVMPQAFALDALLDAYATCSDEELDHGTECLAVALKSPAVKSVPLVRGGEELWKVTYSEDLEKAERWCRALEPLRVGRFVAPHSVSNVLNKHASQTWLERLDHALRQSFPAAYLCDRVGDTVAGSSVVLTDADSVGEFIRGLQKCEETPSSIRNIAVLVVLSCGAMTSTRAEAMQYLDMGRHMLSSIVVTGIWCELDPACSYDSAMPDTSCKVQCCECSSRFFRLLPDICKTAQWILTDSTNICSWQLFTLSAGERIVESKTVEERNVNS